MDRPSSKATVRRKPQSSDTVIRVPHHEVDQDLDDASGEPLIEDFHSLYIDSHRTNQPTNFGTYESGLPTSPEFEADRQLEESLDQEAQPPPILSRNGTNIPNQQRCVYHMHLCHGTNR